RAPLGVRPGAPPAPGPGRGSSGLLGSVVPEPPRLHPPHREQILERHERPVADAVVRDTEAPRAVAHRQLQHATAREAQQRRHEAVEAPEARQAGQDAGANDTQGAPTFLRVPARAREYEW